MNELIYIVEDDEGVQDVYESAFDGLYEARIFGNGKDFFEAFNSRKPSLVIVDIMLPDMDGYRIITDIRARDERIPVIVVSAKTDEMSFVKGLNKAADDYMAKPFELHGKRFVTYGFQHEIVRAHFVTLYRVLRQIGDEDEAHLLVQLAQLVRGRHAV